MKLKNKQFGEVEYTPENVLKFKNGLFGFEELKSYLLIKTDNDLFFWLNSTDQHEVAFPLIGLRLIDDSYPQKEDTEAFGIVLNRKNGEEIKIGNDITIRIISAQDGNTKLGIEAPHDVAILRGELYENIKESVIKASVESKQAIPVSTALTINKLKGNK
jgi:carbon storage regulator CsrA